MSVHPLSQLVLVLLALRTFSPLILAQNAANATLMPAYVGPGADVAFASYGCTLLLMVAVIPLLAIHILILVWVARDAKARSVDNPAVWVLIVVFTGWIGLIVYILSRPEGALVACTECGNKRLKVSQRCPHCGNA